MGWFEKQIKQRNDLDQQMFEDSFFRAASVVLGKRAASKISDEHIITKQAIDEILKYYHLKPVELPKSVKDPEEQIDHCLRPHGLMKRRITLEDNWFSDAYGPVLAYLKDSGEPVALLPNSFQVGIELSAKQEMMRYKIAKKYEKEIASLF